ncbi:MAG: hypothetical protein GWN31_06250, partial [Candidatus Thorarchaeota archaeon]|nr:hypothetical protein [Candidatus Thorarchaeota archaeon]
MRNDGGGPDRPKKESDGFGYPKVERPKPIVTDVGEDELGKPIPVVFTQKTFVKLIAWVLGPVLTILIGSISAFFYFYHQTNTHMQDSTIHLSRGERGKIETKIEAAEERGNLQKDIIQHVNIKVREIKVEQKEQLERTKKDLRRQQNYHYNKIIEEIRERR